MSYDQITYEITKTFLDGPFTNETGTMKIRRSIHAAPVRVGQILWDKDTLFGNGGAFRVESVRVIRD
jgi:hypothetical protein